MPNSPVGTNTSPSNGSSGPRLPDLQAAFVAAVEPALVQLRQPATLLPLSDVVLSPVAEGDAP